MALCIYRICKQLAEKACKNISMRLFWYRDFHTFQQSVMKQCQTAVFQTSWKPARACFFSLKWLLTILEIFVLFRRITFGVFTTHHEKHFYHCIMWALSSAFEKGFIALAFQFLVYRSSFPKDISCSINFILRLLAQRNLSIDHFCHKLSNA